jgi:hypothetical protein
MNFFHNTTNHAEYRSEAAVVLDLVGHDESVQHVVATFPTEAFSGDTTDKEGEISIVSEHLLASAHFATSLTTDSFRYVPPYCPSSTLTSTLIVYSEPAAISLHRDDGSSPRLIAADVSGQRVEGEDIHQIGVQRAQNSGADFID